MNVCSNCGVELEDDFKKCPLCGTVIGIGAVEEKTSLNYPSDVILQHKRENRKHFWELSGIIAFSGMAVCTIVNLVIGKNLDWSLFADASILTTWIILTLILFANRKYYIMVTGIMISILLMLFLFDIFSGSLDWFFVVALPLTVAVFISLSIVVALSRTVHFRGFNLLSIAFLIISGFCIITEMVIDKYLNGVVEIRWSAIAAVSIIPIALVFLFLHYKLKKGKRLDSFFHI